MKEQLPHYILIDSSPVVCRTSLFVILGVSGLFCRFYSFLMEILLANNVGPDQTPNYVASDLGLHSFAMTLLLVSRFCDCSSTAVT